MAEWNECSSCETEFKVITSDLEAEVKYCVFCGGEIEEQFDEDLDGYDEE